MQSFAASLPNEEESFGGDWARVVALSEALEARLRHEPEPECPDAVYHSVGNSDIRQRDEKYALWQRGLVREYVATDVMVEHAPSVVVPWWGCVLAILVPLGVIAWLFIA